MALNVLFMRDLIWLKCRGFLDGYRRVIEVGAQQINDKLMLSAELDEAVRLFGGSKPTLWPVRAKHITADSPPGRLLWESLGFVSWSVDIEGGDLLLDLNVGHVPDQHRGTFDLLINAGTTEHIANQGNAFHALHDLVRVGGLMYHQVPAFGHIDHGFFGYQPKFFHRLAQFNEYEIVFLAMTMHPDVEVPPYLHDRNCEAKVDPLPRTVGQAGLRIAMLKRHAADFRMPTDQ